MKSCKIPLNTLPMFLATAETLSVSKAADKCFVTHSAVSQALKHLETALEVKLFQREHRQMRLTLAGNIFYEYAQKGIDSIQAGVAKIERSQNSHLILLNVNTSLATTWLLPRIVDFETQYPEYRIGINTPHYEVDFAQDPIDCAIFRGEPRRSNLDVTLLAHDEIFIVCKPDYIDSNLTLAEAIETYPLIEIDSPTYSEQWPYFCEQLKLAKPNLESRFTYNNPLVALQAAKNGSGLVLSNHFLVMDALNNGTLIRPFTEQARSGRNFYLVMPKDTAKQEKMQAFKAWLQQQFAIS